MHFICLLGMMIAEELHGQALCACFLKEEQIMKHYIVAKLKNPADTERLVRPVKELFEETLSIPGIHAVSVKPCCVDRPGRFNLMIVIDMDREALGAYDACEPHQRWKKEYGDLLETKAIFDSED